MPDDPARELWLLRHAKSAWDTDAPTDFERPLGKRGVKDAPRMGAWMAAEGLIPDHVVLSPARRAEETLELLLDGMELSGLEVHRDDRIYDAATEDLLAVIRELPAAANRTLLIGHNPGLDEVLLHLASEPPERTATGKLLTTSTLARLALPGGWGALERGSARLLGLVRPRDL